MRGRAFYILQLVESQLLTKKKLISFFNIYLHIVKKVCIIAS